MSSFTPPPAGTGAGELGPGARFDGGVLHDAFRRVRQVLNATVGSYGRVFGENVCVDASSIGAVSVQPDEVTEVFRTDPNKVTDKSFLHLELNTATANTLGHPWSNPRSNDYFPSGASLTVTPTVGGTALVLATVGLSSSWNEHVLEQTGYIRHRASQEFRVLVRNRSSGTAIATTIAYQPGPRYVLMDSSGTPPSLGDTRQATSLTHIGVVQLAANNTYDLYGLLTTGLTITPAVPDPAMSPIIVQQLLGSGSSITVVLLKA